MYECFPHKQLEINYRPGVNKKSSDVKALEEVLIGDCYGMVPQCRVERGECWLDLGANIGAFGLLCVSRGAIARCFEPDQECYKLLKVNLEENNVRPGAAGCDLYNYAITASPTDLLTFYTREQHNPDNHWRGTVCEPVGEEAGLSEAPVKVINLHAKELMGWVCHGIKMDIEGSEGPIIDKWLLPFCSKLVLEYHTSRDPSVSNLARRLELLKSKFNHVVYPQSYDSAIAQGMTEYQPMFDELIFCWDPKETIVQRQERLDRERAIKHPA